MTKTIQKLLLTTLACAACAVGALPAAAEPVLYKIDGNHTIVTFKIKHLGLSNVTGSITGVTGTLLLDEAAPDKGKLEATLDMTTFDTGTDSRDKHIRGPDFFDVEKFPKATIKSTKIEKTATGYAVTVDLTIKDVTKPVVLEVEPPSALVKNPVGALARATTAKGKIVRKDFNLTWNKIVEGVDLVGPEAKLEIEIELIKAVDQPKP